MQSEILLPKTTSEARGDNLLPSKEASIFIDSLNLVGGF